VNNIIFYFGAVIIIVFFIGLAIKRFKEDDKIDLQKHKWIIVTYIILLIMAIIVWRILDLMVELKITQITKYNKTIEEYSNGKK
jgi:NADH:ubiquinone oxidoreductase subunit 6 (subunit J)